MPDNSTATIDSIKVRIEASSEQASKGIELLTRHLISLGGISRHVIQSLSLLNGTLRETVDIGRRLSQLKLPFTSQTADKTFNAFDRLKDVDGNAEKASAGITKFVRSLTFMTTMTRAAHQHLTGLNNALREVAFATSGFQAPIFDQNNGVDSMIGSLDRIANSIQAMYGPVTSLRFNMGSLTGELDGTKTGMDEMAKSTNKAKSALSVMTGVVSGLFKHLGDAVSKVTGKIGRFFNSLKRIAMYRAIRSALRLITQGFKEGIGNLYQWSLAVNANFSPTMDKLASSMLYLKNSFASMFSPLIEYFTPLIEALVDKLVTAFNWVQRLLAQLTGKTTWYQAIKVQTQYQEATTDTADAVKQLREQINLMDWDELNNITESAPAAASAAAPSTEVDPATMFILQPTELEPMEGSFWDNLMKWINDQDWTSIGEKIGTKVREWFENIDWQKVWTNIKNIGIAAAKLLWGLFKGLFPKLAEKLETFWDSVKMWHEDLKKSREVNEQTSAVYELATKITELSGSEGNHGTGGTFGGSGYEFYLAEFNNVSENLQKLYAARRNLMSNVVKTLGLSDQEVQNYEYWWKRYNMGDEEAEHMSNSDPKFAAYIAAKVAYDELEKKITDLTARQKELAIEARKASGAYEVSAAAIYETTNAFDAFNLSLPTDIATVASDILKGFTSADWMNGGKEAIHKLRQGLKQRGFSDDMIELATKSAYAYASYAGWLTVGDDTMSKISSAIENSGIPEEFHDVAYWSLLAFSAETDWAEGTQVTVDQMLSVLEAAGIPEEYRLIGANSMTAFLNNPWGNVPDNVVKAIEDGLNAADMPEDMRKIARASLMAWTQDIDWENGGTLTANDIEMALAQAGIDDEYRKWAKTSIIAFGNGQGSKTWKNLGKDTIKLLSKGVYEFNLPGIYDTTAREAMTAYLSSINWEEGGKASAKDIEKAFIAYGIPADVAKEAAKAAKNWADQNWADAGGFSADYISKAFSKAGIPAHVQRDAAEAIHKWMNETDWSKPGAKSAEFILKALKNSNLDEKYYDVALACIQSMLGADWFDSGRVMANTTLSGYVSAFSEDEDSHGFKGKVSSYFNNKLDEIVKEGLIEELPIDFSLPSSKDIADEANDIIDKTEISKKLKVQFDFSGKAKINTVEDEEGYIEVLNFATGGYVKGQGTLFRAGEIPGQAEMVGNINGRTGVASGQEITGIGDAVWSTGGRTATLLETLIEIVKNKNLVISPSAALGRTVSRSERMYASQMG